MQQSSIQYLRLQNFKPRIPLRAWLPLFSAPTVIILHFISEPGSGVAVKVMLSTAPGFGGVV